GIPSSAVLSSLRFFHSPALPLLYFLPLALSHSPLAPPSLPIPQSTTFSTYSSSLSPLPTIESLSQPSASSLPSHFPFTNAFKSSSNSRITRFRSLSQIVGSLGPLLATGVSAGSRVESDERECPAEHVRSDSEFEDDDLDAAITASLIESPPRPSFPLSASGSTSASTSTIFPPTTGAPEFRHSSTQSQPLPTLTQAHEWTEVVSKAAKRQGRPKKILTSEELALQEAELRRKKLKREDVLLRAGRSKFDFVTEIVSRVAITSVAFRPNSSKLAIRGADGKIHHYASSSKPTLIPSHFPFQTARENSLAFNASGTQLAAGSLDESIRVYHLEKPSVVDTTKTVHRGGVTSSLWEGESVVVSAGADGALRTLPTPHEDFEAKKAETGFSILQARQ
ncbi:hypothetical protein P7C70_g9048, partial [Phenoliferia sp. Uapishka_3]